MGDVGADLASDARLSPGLEDLLAGQNCCWPTRAPRDWIVEYGLIGILVVILLIVMIVYFVRRV